MKRGSNRVRGGMCTHLACVYKFCPRGDGQETQTESKQVRI